MIRIFVTYRRSDSKSFAHRLYDRLRRVFGRTVFMDVSDIEPGADFPKIIEQRLSSCRVLVVVIGNTWASSADSAGLRRLHAAGDYVRLEVSKGLAGNMLVIPVLVNGAAMPSAVELPDDLKPLATRNAIAIDDDRFETDIVKLVEAIEAVVPPRSRWPRIALAVAGVLAAALAGYWLYGKLDRGEGARLVPGFQLYGSLPEEPGGDGMHYDLAVQVDGRTERVADLVRGIVYTGAARPDLKRLQARQDATALTSELTQYFDEQGIDDSKAIVAKLLRSALTVPVSGSKPGARIRVEVGRYEISAGARAQRDSWFHCQFEIARGPRTFFLAPDSKDCRPASP